MVKLTYGSGMIDIEECQEKKVEDKEIGDDVEEEEKKKDGENESASAVTTPENEEKADEVIFLDEEGAEKETGDQEDDSDVTEDDNKQDVSILSDYLVIVVRIAVTIASVVLTWYAHHSKKCSPILASAAVSLIASLASPGLGQASNCASFAGMSSNVILVDGWGAALSLGVLTSILFEVFIHYGKLLLGIGGRLGFVAFIANNALALLRGNDIYSKGAVAPVSLSALVSTSLYTGLGSVSTIVLREASPVSDPVRASAVVGLLAALLAGCHPYYTNASALSIYAGSFAGMSSPSRLLKGFVLIEPTLPSSTNSNKITMSSLALLSIFALAGVIGGIYSDILTKMGLWAAPPGWGGKAGFTSMLGVLTCRLVSKLIRR